MSEKSIDLTKSQTVIIFFCCTLYTFLLLSTLGISAFPLHEIGIFTIIYFPLRKALSLNLWKAILIPSIFAKGLSYILVFSGFTQLPVVYIGLMGVLVALNITGLTETPNKTVIALVGLPTLFLAWSLHLGVSENLKQSVMTGDNSIIKIMSFRIMFSIMSGICIFAFVSLLKIPTGSKLLRQH